MDLVLLTWEVIQMDTRNATTSSGELFPTWTDPIVYIYFYPRLAERVAGN